MATIGSPQYKMWSLIWDGPFNMTLSITRPENIPQNYFYLILHCYVVTYINKTYEFFKKCVVMHYIHVCMRVHQVSTIDLFLSLSKNKKKHEREKKKKTNGCLFWSTSLRSDHSDQRKHLTKNVYRSPLAGQACI